MVPGGSSAGSPAKPESRRQLGHIRCGTHLSPRPWMPVSRCSTCRKRPLTLIRAPPSATTAPGPRWTGTPHTSSLPMSPGPPGSCRLEAVRLAGHRPGGPAETPEYKRVTVCAQANARDARGCLVLGQLRRADRGDLPGAGTRWVAGEALPGRSPGCESHVSRWLGHIRRAPGLLVALYRCTAAIGCAGWCRVACGRRGRRARGPASWRPRSAPRSLRPARAGDDGYRDDAEGSGEAAPGPAAGDDSQRQPGG